MERKEDIEPSLENDECAKTRKEPFWVFGYGSLCWNPGFEYQQSVTGYVKGFSRKFWQGNITHRGTASNPGRVATLIADNEGITWGKAFLVDEKNTTEALPYLSNRECELGGYCQYKVKFYPNPSSTSTSTINQIGDTDALLYIATPENCHWLGDAPLQDIAKQILKCHGPSGPNVEYLLKLADFMKKEIPEALDEHLFSLERLVKYYAPEMNICLKSLMGDDKKETEGRKPEPKAISFQHASRVPDKKLRCVNI